MKPFILSCESTVDMPFAEIDARGIPVLFYSYTAGGEEYADDMERDPNAQERFYQLLQKEIPTTSQLNEYQYMEFFTKLLEQGDVLHIAFGSGMTKSVQGAEAAAEKLRKQFPDRKLIVIDSLCSSSGYGLLVDGAADLRDAGKSLEEVAAWTDKMRHRVHHQFFSTDLKYFRRSGRMSGATATVASILNICPILRLNDEGLQRQGVHQQFQRSRGRQGDQEGDRGEVPQDQRRSAHLQHRYHHRLAHRSRHRCRILLRRRTRITAAAVGNSRFVHGRSGCRRFSRSDGCSSNSRFVHGWSGSVGSRVLTAFEWRAVFIDRMRDQTDSHSRAVQASPNLVCCMQPVGMAYDRVLPTKPLSACRQKKSSCVLAPSTENCKDRLFC